MNGHVRVEFKTIDGTTVRGDFFQAAGESRPCIVMAQGLSLPKEHHIQDQARKFAEDGFSALLYDYRCPSRNHRPVCRAFGQQANVAV